MRATWVPVVEGGIPMLKWIPPTEDTRWADLSPRERWRYAYRAARRGPFGHQYLNPHMLPEYDVARQLRLTAGPEPEAVA